jgi:hypothetical protein
VFVPASVIIATFVVLTIMFPDTAESVIGHLQENVVSWFSWYYVLLIAGFVAFALFIGISRYGDIKLGLDGDEPEFSMRAWFSMLFAAGMGIGLVFWGQRSFSLSPLCHRRTCTGASMRGRFTSSLVRRWLIRYIGAGGRCRFAGRWSRCSVTG